MKENLDYLRDKMEFLTVLETANAVPVLFAMSQKENLTSTDINRLLAQSLGFSLSGGSLKNTLFGLSSQKFIEIKDEYSGQKLLRRRYNLSEKGRKLVKVFKKFLQELEE